MISRFFSFLFCSPLLWGGIASATFYGLVHRGIINNALITRYFAGHPVEYCEAILFFVGFAALIIKGLSVWRQRRYTSKGLFGAVGKPVSPMTATPMLEQLDTLPRSKQNSYLVGRFRAALSFVSRNSSAEGLEDELKYLSDMDASAQQQSYALSRIIVWAIPILGFLGTVIGITVAMGELGVSVSDGGDSLKNMLAGLSVAFDTTALALALSMVLMFTQYVVEGRENDLIATVDKVASRELAGRFEVIPDTPEGELTAIRRMMEGVITTVKEMFSQQTIIWQQAIENTDTRWVERLEKTGDALRRNLAMALNESLPTSISGSINQSLTQQRQAFQTEMQQLQSATVTQFQQSATGFANSVTSLQNAQQELAKQTVAFAQANDKAQQIAVLEKELNDNLAALSGAKNFEKTVATLATAIQMLAMKMNNTNQ